MLGVSQFNVNKLLSYVENIDVFSQKIHLPTLQVK